MKCQVCGTELVGKQTCFCSGKCRNQSTNKKHNNYAAQQKRAVQRKIHFVQMKGGKCSKCGYYKNLAALTFHHRNPDLKSLELDRRILSCYKLERLIEEVEKCDLLCANCHLEHHHPNEENWYTQRESNPQPPD